MMTALGKKFIQFALDQQAFQFGDFKLKSGRVSPYFFNLGLLCEGEVLSQLGRFYADAIEESGIEFDIIFGPAYKGIPLASVAAVCLHLHHNKNKAFAYNRKEAKDHGEEGQLVGASLAGQRVLIVDDVISAGTAVREALKMIKSAGGTTTGIVVSFNRQEKGLHTDSTIAEIEREYNLKIAYIADFDDLLPLIDSEKRKRLEIYFEQYGSSCLK